MKEALHYAPPGIISPQAWAYWNAVAGIDPPLPLPKRFRSAHDRHEPVPITAPLHQMAPLPPTPELLAVARRIVWFKDPADALANPLELLAYAMSHCDDADMALLLGHVSLEGVAEVLDHAPPGIIDPPSWAYWNLRVGRSNPGPPPERGQADPVS